MDKIQKVTGNYIDLLEKMFPENPEAREAFARDSSEAKAKAEADILGDLPRQPFFPSDKKSYGDHVQAWLQSVDKSTAYTQGNMTASFYQLILKTFIDSLECDLDNSKFKPKDKEGNALPLTEDLRLKYRENIEDFSVAYFDDQGIPCGVSIVYSKLDPGLWTASVIRNTTAEPKDRQVLVLSSQDMMNVTNEDLISVSEAITTFFKFLNSHELEQKIGKEVFSAEGLVNIEKLNELMAFGRTLLKGCDEKIELLKQVLKQVPELKESLKQNYNLKEQCNKLLKQQEDNQDQELEAFAKQSFFDRHAKSMAIAALGFAVLISTALILTGVLAPLGLVLAGGIAITLGAVVSAAGAAVLGSGIKIALDERNLSQYQLEQVCIAKEIREIQPKIRKYEDMIHSVLSDTGRDEPRKTVWDALFSSQPSQKAEDALSEEPPRPVISSPPIPEAGEEPQPDSLEETHSSKPTGPK